MSIDKLSFDKVARFRLAVANQALERVCRPYVKVNHNNKHDTVGPGTSDLEGYDCSGLVVVSICGAAGMSPREAWRPDARSLQEMIGILHANSTTQLPLGLSKPVVGSVMVKNIPDPDGLLHCAILTAVNQRTSEIGSGYQYVHSVELEGVILEDRSCPPHSSIDTAYIDPAILALSCFTPKSLKQLRRRLSYQ